MFILTVIALIAVLVVSGLHFAWAGKLWWPISDEKQLVRTVAGFSNVDRMPPPIASLFVAVALFCVALLLFVEIRVPVPHQTVSVSIALFGAGVVFVGRGAIGFTPFWARITPEQPFRKLDLKYFSPLCLAIGAIIMRASLS